MKSIDKEKEERFWQLFERTMGRKYDRQCQEASSTEEWDSLKHVELVFELESEFCLEFSPKDIAKLYSNTNVILDYLHNGTGG
jgi:acyl carrier protein